jgi:uncharacterized membrane protein YccC
MFISPLSALQRYLYSHYFVSGLRQAAGILLVFAISFYAVDIKTASVATIGAAYVAMIDQPTPLWVRVKEMLGGALLGALAVSITGFALDHPITLLIIMIAQTFFFSMLVVYGKRGAVIGLASLSLATLTMHTSLSPHQVMGYSLTSLTGAFAYILYSIISSRLLQLREDEQCLSVAIFAISEYLAARADLYQPGVDIDQGVRKLIAAQAKMVALHQIARDTTLHQMTPAYVQRSPKRLMIWNLLVDMAQLVDGVMSTHADYSLLHSQLGKSDVMRLTRDTFLKMVVALEQIARAVTQQTPINQFNFPHAELLALETELDTMKRHGVAEQESEIYALSVQILGRLKKTQSILENMVEQTQLPKDATPLFASLLEQSLSSFMSPVQSFKLKWLANNLRVDSPPFRFALRVSLAVSLAMIAGMFMPATGAHGYWVVLTIIIIMKPAFSLTKKRNGERVVGTLIGCALTYVLLSVTTQPDILWAVFAISLMLTFLFMIVMQYLALSVFMTVVVLIMLHAFLPNSGNFVNERALDTVIGSIIAFGCSFFMPWWESKSIPSLALGAIKANENLLRASLRSIKHPGADPLVWQLACQHMQLAYSQFAESLSRMAGDPVSKQNHTAQYNNLLVEVYIMAAEIINTLDHVHSDSETLQIVKPVLQRLGDAVETLDLSLASQDISWPHDSISQPDWLYQLQRLQKSTKNVIEAHMTLQALNA